MGEKPNTSKILHEHRIQDIEAVLLDYGLITKTQIKNRRATR